MGPEPTALRVALWRALHVEVDPPPHVLEDTIGLHVAAPDESWRERPDMDPQRTAQMRASIVARARFIEDLVEQRSPAQYVILGAGLDTFAQRTTSATRVVEVDRPEPQEWKRRRLIELGMKLPQFVGVDFESDWWAAIPAHDRSVVASAGVSMYLTRDAVMAMLRHAASFPRGSTFVMTYLLPPELLAGDERQSLQWAMQGAKASGTPFISLFTPDEIMTLAREAGFGDVSHVSGDDQARRYFASRTDGLRPGNGEQILVATT